MFLVPVLRVFMSYFDDYCLNYSINEDYNNVSINVRLFKCKHSGSVFSIRFQQHIRKLVTMGNSRVNHN